MKVAKWIFIIVVIIFLNYQRAICGIQHWTLNEKKIIPLLSSPYYLRNPNDLVAFLNQSVFKKRLDNIMKELISIKANLTQKMNKVINGGSNPSYHREKFRKIVHVVDENLPRLNMKFSSYFASFRV
jgi:hypothetical protein